VSLTPVLLRQEFVDRITSIHSVMNLRFDNLEKVAELQSKSINEKITAIIERYRLDNRNTVAMVAVVVAAAAVMIDVISPFMRSPAPACVEHQNTPPKS
jgi:hypothetical protein